MKGTANPGGPFSRGAQKGAAYVYRRSTATGAWYQEAKLFLDDGLGTDRYGWQVGTGNGWLTEFAPKYFRETLRWPDSLLEG